MESKYSRLEGPRCYMTPKPTHNKKSDEYKVADIIQGAVSADENEARRKKWFANPGGKKQIPDVSYEGCKHLLASFAAIMYFFQ